MEPGDVWRPRARVPPQPGHIALERDGLPLRPENPLPGSRMLTAAIPQRCGGHCWATLFTASLSPYPAQPWRSVAHTRATDPVLESFHLIEEARGTTETSRAVDFNRDRASLPGPLITSRSTA